MALILIMGLPGAGKSTLRRRLVSSAHPELIESTSFDDFRRNNEMQMCSMDNATARDHRKAFESHLDSKIGGKFEFPPKIYLIEDTFHLKSMRRAFLKISKKRNLKFGVVFLKCTTSEAIRRNSERDLEKKINEETILKISENLEFSDSEDDDGKWIILEQEEALGIDLEAILKRLDIRIEDSEVLEEKKIPNPPPTSPPTRLQNLDVITRRLVSELIQNDRSLDGRKLSEARKILLLGSKNLDSELETTHFLLKQKLMDFYEELL